MSVLEHLTALAGIREDYERELREAERRFQEERDRRMAEVAEARAEALKIKETADRDALGLAREIQTYKDEKANELREQINSERGLYPTKDDLANSAERLEAMIKPLAEYVTAQQGRAGGFNAGWAAVVSLLGAVSIVIAIIVKL